MSHPAITAILSARRLSVLRLGGLLLWAGLATGAVAQDSGGATIVLNNSVNRTGGSITLNRVTLDNTAVGNGTLTLGDVTLYGVSSSSGTGNITLENGTVNFGSLTGTPGGGNVTFGAGSLALSTTPTGSANGITITGTFADGLLDFGGASEVNFTGGNATFGGGTITLGSIATTTSDSGGSLSLVGGNNDGYPEYGYPEGAVIYAGGANNYTGGSISAGTVNFGGVTTVKTVNGIYTLNTTNNYIGTSLMSASGSVAAVEGGTNFASTLQVHGGTITFGGGNFTLSDGNDTLGTGGNLPLGTVELTLANGTLGFGNETLTVGNGTLTFRAGTPGDGILTLGDGRLTVGNESYTLGNQTLDFGAFGGGALSYVSGSILLSAPSLALAGNTPTPVGGAGLLAAVIRSGGFSFWQLSHFTSDELGNATVSGPMALPGPGAEPNLLKYALGLAPRQTLPPDRFAMIPDSSTVGTFTYQRPASVTDVTYVVETSTDLINWTSSGVTQVRVSPADAAGLETWWGTCIGINTGPNTFFRLRVTQP